MAKIINKYRAYSATTINTRASDTCDRSTVGNTVECTNVKLSKVHTVLNSADYSLANNCTSPNINLWSGFGPIKRSVSSGILSCSVGEAPYKLGDFAGYNHSAPAPSYADSSRTTSVRVYGVGATATKAVSVTIGEPKYLDPDITNASPLGVALALYDGYTFRGAGVQDLNSCTDGADLTAETDAVYSSTILTGSIYLVDSTSSFASNGSNIVCKLPGLNDFNFSATVLLSNYLAVQNSDMRDGGDSLLTTTNGVSWSSTNGNLTWVNMHSNIDLTGLTIYARLSHQIDGLIEDYLIYDYTMDGDYYANTVISGGTHTFTSGGGAPYESYGYIFQFLVELGA